jgi:hypothetical protein
MEDKPPIEIDDKTRFPLAIVVSVVTCSVTLAVYGTVLYENLKQSIDDARFEARQARLNCVSESQFQNWRDIQTAANYVANASVKWEPLPPKLIRE